jgi:hypothetical protein
MVRQPACVHGQQFLPSILDPSHVDIAVDYIFVCVGTFGETSCTCGAVE